MSDNDTWLPDWMASFGDWLERTINWMAAFWADWYKNQSDMLGDFFGITGAQTESGSCFANDGRFVCLVKGQTNRVMSSISNVTSSIDRLYNLVNRDLMNKLDTLDLRSTQLRDEIGLLRGVFNVSSGNETTGAIYNGDGVIARLLKGQTSRIVTAIEAFRARNDVNFNDYFKATNYSGTYIGENGDSPLARLIKAQTTRITSALDPLNVLQDTFKISSEYGSSHTTLSGDGHFARLLKGQTNRIVAELQKLTPIVNLLGAQSGQEGTSNLTWTNDSPIVKVMKGQTNRIVAELQKIPPLLGAQSGQEATSNLGWGADSPIVKVIKGQTNRLINELATLQTIANLLGAQDNHYDRDNLTWAADSPIVKVMKGQTNRIVTAIGNISGGSDFKPLEDVLKRIETAITKQSTDLLKAIGDGVKDIVKAIGDIEIGDSGSNVWDFLISLIEGLTGTFGDILDFLENLFPQFLEFFIEAFVPQDDFVGDWFKRVNDDFSQKFIVIEQIEQSIITPFRVEQKDLPTFNATLPSIGTIKIFDPTYINEYLPLIRRILSGIMMIATLIYSYKKITGNGGVVE